VLNKTKYKRYFLTLLPVAFLVVGYFIRAYHFEIPYNFLVSKSEIDKSKLKWKESGFSLKNIAPQLGLNFDYHPPRISPQAYYRVDSLVQAPGAAIIDVNNDGFMDMLVLSAVPESPNHLYINQLGNGFIESAKNWGIDKTTTDDFSSIQPVIFDMDNDGDSDLYIAGLGCARFYENTGTSFVEKTSQTGVRDCANAQAATFFDYDGDGLLDLYVLRYWRDYDLLKTNDPYIYVNNLHNATNGGTNTLYRNLGNFKFQDVTKEVGAADFHWSYDATYADLDDDGNFELYISNDYGADRLYRLENGKFTDISSTFSVPDRRYSMNTSLVDTGTPKPHIYVSNLHAGYNWGLYGNFFWQMSDSKNISDEAKRYNVFACGMAWGAAHADFNLDGKEDLYITNGFSPKRRHYDRELAAKDDEQFSHQSEAASFYYEWFVRSLSGEYSEDIRRWTKLIIRGSRNDQSDCLMLNMDNKTFAYSNEFTDIEAWNGKAAVTIDANNDGVLDLLVTTNNGPLKYFKNTVKKSDNWVGLKLIGKSVNRDGVGARVKMSQGENTYHRWLTGGRSGLIGTSDSRVHVGLSNDANINVEIKWPNGQIQKINDLKTGAYYEVIQSI